MVLWVTLVPASTPQPRIMRKLYAYGRGSHNSYLPLNVLMITVSRKIGLIRFFLLITRNLTRRDELNDSLKNNPY